MSRSSGNKMILIWDKPREGEKNDRGKILGR